MALWIASSEVALCVTNTMGGTTSADGEPNRPHKSWESLRRSQGTLVYGIKPQGEATKTERVVERSVAKQFITHSPSSLMTRDASMDGAVFAEHHNRMLGLFDMWHLTAVGRGILDAQRTSTATAQRGGTLRIEYTYNAGGSIVPLLASLYQELFGITKDGEGIEPPVVALDKQGDPIDRMFDSQLTTREALALFVNAATKIVRLHMQAIQQQWPVELGVAHANTQMQIHQLQQQRAFAA